MKNEKRKMNNQLLFEYIEHTADVGLIAYGRTLAQVFENAALGMFNLICDLSSLRSERVVRVELEGDNWEALLVHWLKELLYEYEVGGLLFNRFSVEIDEGSKAPLICLKGVAKGQHRAEAQTTFYHYVKAVTYHGLRVEQEGGIWRAQVVFDV